MNRFSISNLVKFLIGILLVQGVTALLVVTALKADLSEIWLLIITVALLTGSLAAFWFASIASHANRQALAKANEKFGKKQESARKRAEKEKAKEVGDAHRRAIRETKRTQQSTNVKLVSALAGVSAVSVALLFTQFMTLGLLATAAVGGALLGYGVRMRQALKFGKGEEPETLKRLPDPAQKSLPRNQSMGNR